MVERHLRYRTVECFPTELAQRGLILPENGPIGSQSPVGELDGPRSATDVGLKDEKKSCDGLADISHVPKLKSSRQLKRETS